MDWMSIRHFTPQELACKCGKCGNKENMDLEFMSMLDELRGRLGRPLTITSGFRCPEHPSEVNKSMPGAHSAGTAADIAVGSGRERYEIMKEAFAMGFVGIAPAKGFVHVDFGHPSPDMRPSSWTY